MKLAYVLMPDKTGSVANIFDIYPEGSQKLTVWDDGLEGSTHTVIAPFTVFKICARTKIYAKRGYALMHTGDK